MPPKYVPVAELSQRDWLLRARMKALLADASILAQADIDERYELLALVVDGSPTLDAALLAASHRVDVAAGIRSVDILRDEPTAHPDPCAHSRSHLSRDRHGQSIGEHRDGEGPAHRHAVRAPAPTSTASLSAG
jgi:hypothetical protein